MSKRLADQLWDMVGVVDRDSVQFLCIGSMLLIGDAVAPIVGTMLADMGYEVFGTEDYTLNAENILSRCEDFDPSKTHIAIDCSVLSLNSKRALYESVLVKGGIYPGAGLGRSLGCYGEYGIHIPMAFNRVNNNLTVRDLADYSEDFVRKLAREVYYEIELYLFWCDEAIYGIDTANDRRERSCVEFDYSNRILIDDIEINQYVKSDEDNEILLNLGDIIYKGYTYPKGLDFKILELFNRNFNLYEMICRNTKTRKIIQRNDFVKSAFETGAKVYTMEYANSNVTLSYLKDYVAYMDIKPEFKEFVDGMAVYGFGYNDSDYLGMETDLFEEYVKWW